MLRLIPDRSLKRLVNKPRRAPRRRVDGVLLLDKPGGMTSNAALQKVRWLLNAEKGGHTGTLDPLATGLLPLCFGDATKFAGEMLDAGKTYLATVRLGIETDTADADGQVTAEHPVTVGEADVQALLPRFIGAIEQVPPMYSALKRDGKPLYELARQGIEVERQARQIEIFSLVLSHWSGNSFDLRVDCSKGTYVRTLAADIGKALGCGAHLSALRRTRIAHLQIEAAVTLDAIESRSAPERDTLLMPPDALLSGMPEVQLAEQEAARLLHGQAIRWHAAPSRQCRLYGPAGFIGTGEMGQDGWLKPKRLIAPG